MINAISIALSGLTASVKRVEASASNIANVSTTGALNPADGPAPYTPLTTTQKSVDGGGVRAEIVTTEPAFTPAFSPNSPFANADGLIAAPNIDLATEAVNLKLAELTYKANLQTIRTAEEMSDELLSTFDDRA